MRATDLNFAPRGHRHKVVAVLILIVLAAGAGLSYKRYVKAKEKLQQVSERLTRLKREKSLKTLVVLPDAATVKREQDAGAVLKRLRFPWQEFFSAVEAAHTSDVSLLELDPNVESRSVRISGEAKDFSAAANYVARLQQQDQFSRVYLAKHKLLGIDSSGPVSFEVTAEWRPSRRE